MDKADETAINLVALIEFNQVAPYVRRYFEPPHSAKSIDILAKSWIVMKELSDDDQKKVLYFLEKVREAGVLNEKTHEKKIALVTPLFNDTNISSMSALRNLMDGVISIARGISNELGGPLAPSEFSDKKAEPSGESVACNAFMAKRVWAVPSPSVIE